MSSLILIKCSTNRAFLSCSKTILAEVVYKGIEVVAITIIGPIGNLSDCTEHKNHIKQTSKTGQKTFAKLGKSCKHVVTELAPPTELVFTPLLKVFGYLSGTSLSCLIKLILNILLVTHFTKTGFYPFLCSIIIGLSKTLFQICCISKGFIHLKHHSLIVIILRVIELLGQSIIFVLLEERKILVLLAELDGLMPHIHVEVFVLRILLIESIIHIRI